MIFTKTILVFSLILLSFTNTQAANVDFKSIYNNASETCNVIQTSKDCKNINETNTQCDSTKSKDVPAGIKASANKQCVNVKADNHVEPRFSTKRPRGQ